MSESEFMHFGSTYLSLSQITRVLTSGVGDSEYAKVFFADGSSLFLDPDDWSLLRQTLESRVLPDVEPIDADDPPIVRCVACRKFISVVDPTIRRSPFGLCCEQCANAKKVYRRVQASETGPFDFASTENAR